MALKYTIVFIVLFDFANSAKLPSKWKKCRKGDGECLKTAIQDAIKDLEHGNKALRMLPMDPLHFNKLELNQGGQSPVNINLTFYNLDLIGASRVQLNSAMFDTDKHEINIDMNIVDGNSYLVGDYEIAGSVLVLPIKGKGKCNITFEDLNIKVKFIGSEHSKGGRTHYHVGKSEFVMNPKRAQFWFGNLFDGVPNLGDNMNRFLNENWEEIMGELSGTISKAMGIAFEQIANTFFKAVPLDQINLS